MAGKRKMTSRRSKREINDLFRESYDATKKAIKAINQKLDDGKGLSDEEFRFLKRSKDLIKSFRDIEEEADEVEGDHLPEGALKAFVEREWRLREICRDKNLVIESTGYYRCEECGECHIKGRKCFYKEYKKKMGMGQ